MHQEFHCHEFTEDEVRKKFLDHAWYLIEYWAGEGDSNVDKNKPTKERIEGFAHSLFAMIAGCSGDIPGFILAPCPHDESKAYNRSRGEDYWPENHESDVKCDIGSALNELFYRYKDKES